jgi:hypothetical protein
MTTPMNVPASANGPGPNPVEQAGSRVRLVCLGMVLSCNSLLGISRASLECDTRPCSMDLMSDAGVPSSLDTPEAGDVMSVGPGRIVTGSPARDSSMEGPRALAGPTAQTSANPGVDAAVPPAESGTPSAPVVDGGAPGAACSNGGDVCGDCLCGECENEVAACTAAEGCFEIVACARINRCVGIDCFCGSINPVACATGGTANGPCVDVLRAAPGSRAPTLSNPSVGPASDAALAIATCTAQRCAAACPN